MKEIDIEKRLKEFPCKTNVDILKSGRTFDNRIKNLEKEMKKLLKLKLKTLTKVKS